ncbi:YciI family protein [Actinomycetes bacterium M1A6_2h]
MAHFVISYTYSSSTTEGRDQYRAEHREWLRGLLDEEVLVVSGPYTDDSGALIIVLGDDAASVRSLFEKDPFARENLIEETSISEWKPVMGALS